MVRFYEGFEVDHYTGKALNENDMIAIQSQKIQNLQRIAFQKFQPELKHLVVATISQLENRATLTSHLSPLSDTKLRYHHIHPICDSNRNKIFFHRELAIELALLPEKEEENTNYTREFVLEIICAYLEKRISQLESISQMPIYPTEELLWDSNIIPSDEYTGKFPRNFVAIRLNFSILGEHCLALPKLNLQFLTVHDYLLRNYDLFRLESSYEIRGDLEDAISRINPRRDYDGIIIQIII
jgi:intron-binding protein aquarius